MEDVKRRNRVKGSFTVEAAFVMPVVLLVLFLLIRTGLMLYEEARTDAEAARALEKGEMAVRHLGDVQSGRPDYESLFLEPPGMVELEEGQLSFSGIFPEEKRAVLIKDGREWSVSIYNPAEYRRRIGK